MNGAHALIETLVAAGVDTCFMNPGTSEMHFVAALDDVPDMHSVLALFEGVATGAAEGYARMAGKPAAVLLHLGPGLGNGLANLHNARRGRVPVVNIIGDHATYHEKYDAPLQSDIHSIAKGVSGWIHRSTDPDEVGSDTARAVEAAYGRPGQVATLILPADVCWLESSGPGVPLPVPAYETVPADRVAQIAAILRSGSNTALLMGGGALMEPGLVLADKIAGVAGAKLLAETFPTRMERGAGVPGIDRLAYLAEFAQMQLGGLDHLILVETGSPVSFFAYPDKASDLVPEGCQVSVLTVPGEDSVAALDALASLLDAHGHVSSPAEYAPPALPTGAITAETFAQVVGALLPEDAVLVDESNTSGLFLAGATANSARHDLLCLPGGAIGFGMPAATGAALAVPERRVINLQADGSAMYTMQSLWTQARENLDVTTVILNNGSYSILNLELSRVGANPGPRALDMLDIGRPNMDFVALATGMGVPAERATTADEFAEQFARSLATPGPSLIELVLPPAI